MTCELHALIHFAFLNVASIRHFEKEVQALIPNEESMAKLMNKLDMNKDGHLDTAMINLHFLPGEDIGTSIERVIKEEVTVNTLPMGEGIVGRDEDVERVKEACTNGSKNIVVLKGKAGAGKTAVASNVAHLLVEKGMFRGGRAWAHLNQVRREGAISRIARSMKIRTYENKREDLLAGAKEALGSLPFLLVVDGAEAAVEDGTLSQLLSTLVGVVPEMTIIVTARDGLGKAAALQDSIHEIEINALASKDAETLFDDLGRKSELASACGCNPGAIHVVATVLRNGETHESDMLDRILKIDAKMNDPPRAATQAAVNALSEQARRAMEELSIFPASFTVGAAAAILDSEEASARQTLNALSPLLHVDNLNYRLAVPTLVASSAVEGGKRGEEKKRFASYYCERLAQWAGIYAISGGGMVGTQLLEEEVHNIDQVQSMLDHSLPAEVVEVCAGQLYVAYALLRARNRAQWVAGLYQHVSHLADEKGKPGARSLALERLGEVLLEMGHFEQAEKAATQAYEKHAQRPGLPRSEEGSFAGHSTRGVSNLCVTMAGCLQAKGDFSGADRWYREAVNRSKEDRREYAAAENNLALFLRDRSDLEEAEQCAREALKLYEETTGTSSAEYGTACDNLALILRDKDKTDEAASLHERAMETRKECFGEHHPKYSASLSALASLNMHMGETELAKEHYDAACRLAKEALGSSHPHYATCLNNVGLAYRASGDSSRAIDLHSQALSVYRETIGESHPHFATCLNNLAQAYKDAGRMEEAERASRQALQIRKDRLGTEDPQYAQSLTNLALLLKDEGKFSEAEQLLQETAKVRKQRHGERHPRYANALNNLANLASASDRLDEAIRLYRLATRIFNDALGSEHPSTVHAAANYSSALKKAQRENNEQQ